LGFEDPRPSLPFEGVVAGLAGVVDGEGVDFDEPSPPEAFSPDPDPDPDPDPEPEPDPESVPDPELSADAADPSAAALVPAPERLSVL
jgi:hypothetical protein